MYSYQRNDDQKFTSASSPPTAPPLPQFGAAPAIGIPVSSANPGAPIPWSSGLCDCHCHDKSCCLTCWCPCVAFGQISEIVDEGSSYCVVNGALYALLMWTTGCQACYSSCNRTKMRQQYNLEEGSCSDCLVHCCCGPCAICQEYRELESRGFEPSLGWQGNTERRNRGLAMAPIVQQGMTR